MKNRHFISLVLILFISSLAIINLSGCGAIAAIVSAIFGSQAGFVFIPFLSGEKLSGSETGKQPGMIMLFTNNPPANYKSLSGATVSIKGGSGTATTKEDGSFYLAGLPVGVDTLKVEHPSWVSIQQKVAIADPNITVASFSNFRIIPDKLLSPVGIGGTFQFTAFGDSPSGTPIIPFTTWSVIGDIGTISSTGIFTATKAGTGNVKAVSGSNSAEVSVTVVQGTGTVSGKVLYNGLGVANAEVRVDNTNLYTITDPNGSYSIPGVPSTTVLVTATDQVGRVGSIIIAVPSSAQVEGDIVLLSAIPTPTRPGGPTATPIQTFTPTPIIPLWKPNVKAGTGSGGIFPSVNRIAVSPSGNAYAIWSWNDNNVTYMSSSYCPSGGNWRPDSAPVNTNAWSQSIAIDFSGNTYVIWGSQNLSDPMLHQELYSSYRSAGGNWGAAQRVDDGVATTWFSSSIVFSSIAVDASGNLYAIWGDGRNYDPNNMSSFPLNLYFSYRPSGGNWSTNVRVDDGPIVNNTSFPSIAVDSSGNAYAVWIDNRNNPNGDIYFSYRPAGGSWSHNVRVDNKPAGDFLGGTPSIAVDSSGKAYVVWSDNRNGKFHLYFSYRPAGGNWSSNTIVDDAPSGTDAGADPCLTIDLSGNLYAIWEDVRNSDPNTSSHTYDIYFSYRPAGGNWSTNVRVDDAPANTDVRFPSIAVDSSGKAYAIWSDNRNGSWEIYSSTTK